MLALALEVLELKFEDDVDTADGANVAGEELVVVEDNVS